MNSGDWGSPPFAIGNALTKTRKLGGEGEELQGASRALCSRGGIRTAQPE